jgi:L-amino acid N-acyltransferase YncA
MQARPATLQDAQAIASIYNEGIADRATFETRLRTAEEVERWFDGIHPIVVVEDHGQVIAYAATFTYRANRECYVGVAEFSIYAARQARGRGAGRLAMEALIVAAKEAGFWKLLSRVFPENAASLRLLRSCGFREVGVYQKHGKVEGVWKDVVIVERLLDDRTEPSPKPANMWTVYRQDDNGNRFVMEKHLSREEAEGVVAQFEARGHKQLYWAEPEQDSHQPGRQL